MDLKLLPVASPQAKASASPEDKKKRSHEGLVGLVNIGNSCYMNAAIQALSNCPAFRQYFVECYHPMTSSSHTQQRAADVLANIYKKMWVSDRPPGHLSPRSLSCSMQNRLFRTSLQHDSQEFLRCLLMQLHDETGIEVPSWVSVANGSHDHTSGFRDSFASSLSHDSDISNLSAESNQQGLLPNDGKGVGGGGGGGSGGGGGGGGVRESPLLKKKNRFSLKQAPSHSSSQVSPPNQRRFSLLTPHAKPRSGSSSCGVAGKGSNESINRSPMHSHPTHDQRQLRESQVSFDLSPSSDTDVGVVSKWGNGIVLEVDLTTREVIVHRNCHIFDSKGPNLGASLEEEEEEIGERRGGGNHEEGTVEMIAKRREEREEEGEGVGGGEKGGRKTAGSNSSSPIPSVQPRQQQAQKSPKLHSIVTEVFEGLLESKVKCGACKKVSIVHEPFQDLSLPIPGRKEMAKFQRAEGDSVERNGDVSSSRGGLSRGFCSVMNLVTHVRDMFAGPPTDIQDCLNTFFDPCELKGNNQYYCKHCKKLQNSQKEMRIIKLPEVLCVHLKRFRFDSYFSSKISRHITFPLQNLELSSFLKNPAPQGNTSYDLSAVITHYGNAGFGHYVTFARNSSHNAWYEFNDTKVRPVSVETLTGAESYVLFYKRTLPANSVAAQNVELSSLLLPSPGCPRNSPNPVCYISRHWLHLLRTCSSPGPIFQHEFCCEHGAVLPHRGEDARSLAMAIRRDVWDSFQQRYGGGPLVVKLEVCATCKTEVDKLNERRAREKDDIYKLQTVVSTSSGQVEKREAFLLSLEWLHRWQNFIHCSTLAIGPPGPVDNSSLLQEGAGPTGNLCLHEHTKESPLYRKLSWATWSYFIKTYGGGPTLTTSMSPPPN